MTTIFARATAGDVAWLDATLNRIAAVLALQGDEDPRAVRRSKALGILAQPARALLMLARYEDACCDFDLDEAGAPHGGVPDDGVPHLDAECPFEAECPFDAGEPGREGEAAEGDGWDRDVSGDVWEVSDADRRSSGRRRRPRPGASGTLRWCVRTSRL